LTRCATKPASYAMKAPKERSKKNTPKVPQKPNFGIRFGSAAIMNLFILALFVIGFYSQLSAQHSRIIGESYLQVERRVGEFTGKGRDPVEQSYRVYEVYPDVSHPWRTFKRVSLVVDREGKVDQLLLGGLSAQQAKAGMEAEAEGWKAVNVSEGGTRVFRSEKPSLYAAYRPDGDLIIWTPKRHAQFIALNNPSPFATRPWDQVFLSFGLN
jgi:hypothetical protein